MTTSSTQPVEWVWTNISPEKLALWITIWTAVISAAIYGVFKLVNIFIDQWFGSKKLWKERQQEMELELAKIKDNQRTLAQATSETVPTTQAILDKVDAIAKE